MRPDTPRATALQRFLQHALDERQLQAAGAWRAITGDASFRHFHRVPTQSGSVVLVDAPPATENNSQYQRIATHWRAAGLPLPEILASDLDQGFFLVTDFGDRLLGEVLKSEPPTPRYQQALALLLRIQRLPDDGTCPPYEMSRFRMELTIFREWFLDKLLGQTLTHAEQSLLDATEHALLTVIQRQHRVCVHRDFHSRNLLLLNNDELGIVDFQDALFGPYSYDVVSLLRDCYVRWPDTDVNAWRDHYAALATEQLPAQHIARGALQHLVADFDYTGMQRHMKAIGIFARLWVRDGRAGYLPDIPRVLGYLIDVSAGYAELAAFGDWLQGTIAPRFAALAAVGEAVGEAGRLASKGATS